MRVEMNDPELDQVLKELAVATGESEERSIATAVRERLARVNRIKGRQLLESIRDIQDRVAAMPELDPRNADEIIGYNEQRLFD